MLDVVMDHVRANARKLLHGELLLCISKLDLVVLQHEAQVIESDPDH